VGGVRDVSPGRKLQVEDASRGEMADFCCGGVGGRSSGQTQTNPDEGRASYAQFQQFISGK
jgi:Fe-S oxidoreductase